MLLQLQFAPLIVPGINDNSDKNNLHAHIHILSNTVALKTTIYSKVSVVPVFELESSGPQSTNREHTN